MSAILIHRFLLNCNIVDLYKTSIYYFYSVNRELMGKGLIYMSSVKNIITGVLVAVVLIAPIIYDEVTARYEQEIVTVHTGDTLFSLIAEREPEGDIRESVYRTRELNKLEGNQYLQPGDEIILVIRKE